MCDELAWRLEAAAEHGVLFSVEAHLGSIAPTPAAAKKLVHDAPGLTLTLDYTHFTRQGRAGQRRRAARAAGEPFPRARRAAKGRLQTSFDENAIDYARIGRQLQAANYRGYLGIEYVWTEWEQCNRVDNLSETIRWHDFSARRKTREDRLSVGFTFFWSILCRLRIHGVAARRLADY